MLERLSGSGHWGHVWVLADATQGDLHSAVRNVSPLAVGGTASEPTWEPAAPAPAVGVVVFDQARLYNERERAFWMPSPEQLLAVATRMKAQGVHSLAVLVPHQQALLPDALKRGLASLDEQAVQTLGFERLLIVRRAEAGQVARRRAGPQQGLGARLAAWMLSQLRFMVPQREQPVRSVKLAAFAESALTTWIAADGPPSGTRVVPPEALWDAAAQADTSAAARHWMHTLSA